MLPVWPNIKRATHFEILILGLRQVKRTCLSRALHIPIFLPWSFVNF